MMSNNTLKEVSTETIEAWIFDLENTDRLGPDNLRTLASYRNELRRRGKEQQGEVK